jgi:hypothetical protein
MIYNYIGKYLVYTLNYQESPFFNLQLQNLITKDIQLLKPGKFGPLDGFEDGFSLREN